MLRAFGRALAPALVAVVSVSAAEGPVIQLELALFLESDRMRSLDITKANLDNQRNAVQEERRLGLDNQPYGKTYERIGEQAYDNPAYKHSVIGSMEDLNAASVDDVA